MATARKAQYIELEEPLADALQRIATATGLTKRAVLEATLADRIGTPHIARLVVKAAWLQLRREINPS